MSLLSVSAPTVGVQPSNFLISAIIRVPAMRTSVTALNLNFTQGSSPTAGRLDSAETPC